MTDQVDAGPRPRPGAAMAFWAVLGLACLAPVAALVATMLLVSDDIASLSPPTQPILVEARMAQVDGSTATSAALTWSDGPAIVAPAWTGLVTSVSVSPGHTLRTGVVVARIDGTDRLAVNTPRPFHRSLAGGDRGPDVQMLRTVLRTLGYDVRPQSHDDYLDVLMSTALRSLESKLANVNVASGTFQPAWFAWLPTESMVLHEVKVVAGRPAPGMGEPIAVGAPTLTGLKVNVSDSMRLHDAPYGFVYGKTVVQLTKMYTAHGEALAALGGAVSGGLATVDGRLRLVDTQPALVVPVSAVQTGKASTHCVHVASGDGYARVLVTVAGGGFGTAEIASGLNDGDTLLANPAELGLTCD